MKAKAILSCVVMYLLPCFMLSTSAQIGIRGGVGISDIAFLKYGQSPYLGYEIDALEHRFPRAAFQIGAFRTFNLNERFVFQPEFLYSNQGLTYGAKYLYDDITYKVNIHYLKIPLLLRYNIFVRQNRQSGLFAGPYASWKIGAMRTTEIEGETEKNKISNVRKVDAGVIAGYSVCIDLPAGQLNVDFRSGFSLTNMMDTIEGYVPWYLGPSKEYARNVTISLTVGYQFLNLQKRIE